MKIKASIGKLIPGFIGIIASLGWFYIDKRSYSSIEYSPEMLAKRWCEIATYLGLWFGLVSGALFFTFRKRLKREVTLLSFLNVITAWAFVTLYFIFSDNLANHALAQLGMTAITWLFLVAGGVWSIVAFYSFARAVDASLKRE